MLLSVIHRDIGEATRRSAAQEAAGIAWRTCLREVTFLDDAVDPDAREGVTPLRGAAAYAFLLETICGLRSPMLGETQVLGQFRTFLASLTPAQASWLSDLGQQLITDARQIRDRHLRGLGSRSYGSAVRKHLAGAESVALVGAGALATDLLPYLSEGRRVDQWTRQDIVRAHNRPASDASPALVIAAPVRARDIAAVAACYRSVLRVIDLRDAEQRDPLTLASPISTLDDLFADVAAASMAAEPRVETARNEIQGMAAAFERRHQVRPFGWDDLCA